MEGGKISLALGGARKPPPPKSTNGIKRSHASLREEDEDEDQADRPQKVSHFDKAAGGAIGESQPKAKGPLIITAQANRDWREASKRQESKKGLPADAQNGQVSEQTMKEFEDKLAKPRFGLNVTKRETEDGAAQPSINGVLAANGGDTHAIDDIKPEAVEDVSTHAKTDDEEALEALLGNKKKSGLVLPAINEEEAFAQDFRSAPDMATMDDYDRVPVEEFGAALLRGMGWKDGEGIGAQRGKKVELAKVPEKRPALLGIGAKEEAAVAEEMGSWGKAARNRKGAPQVYNPILLRDKKTGEMFTEEELRKKKERDQREQYELEFEQKERIKRKETRDEDDRDGRREKDRGRDRSRDRRKWDDSDGENSSRRRDKDRERRRRNDGDGEEYYRRKEKERKRRERDRDGDYDRESSRKYDSGRERHRDRDHRR